MPKFHKCTWKGVRRWILLWRNAYVIFRSSTQTARFALNALPRILLDRNDHVGSELQTGRMSWDVQKTYKRIVRALRRCSKHKWTVFWGNWPDRPQSAHDTSSSLCPVFLLFFSSPKQKSQYFPFLGGSPSLSKYQNTVELKASTHELKAFTLINTTVTQHEHKHLVSIRNQLKTS